jgi:hypothetical protein
MTEEEWFAADYGEIYRVIALLTPRRQRLLAAAVCRVLLPWINFPSVQNALGVIETFADTGKTKAALRRARQAIAATRKEQFNLSRGQQWMIAIERALFVVSNAASDDPLSGTIPQAIEALAVTGGISVQAARSRLRIPYCEIVGRAGHPMAFLPEWRTTTTVQLAQQMYESRNYSTMPILADALQDASCDNEDILNHCRESSGVHVRGCWVLDLILSKDR